MLGRGLLLLLVVGVAAQVVSLTIHPPVEIVVAEASGEEGGDDHEPGSCDLCQALSQVRAQAPNAIVPVLAAAASERRAAVPAAAPVASGSRVSVAGPRAPPRSIS